MVQRGGGARFLLEPRAGGRGSAANAAGSDLDGDVAPEPRIAGAIDLAHAAGAKGGHDRVRSEPSAGRQLQG